MDSDLEQSCIPSPGRSSRHRGIRGLRLGSAVAWSRPDTFDQDRPSKINLRVRGLPQTCGQDRYQQAMEHEADREAKDLSSEVGDAFSFGSGQSIGSRKITS